MSIQNEPAEQMEEEKLDIVSMLLDYLHTLKHMWVWVAIFTLLGGGLAPEG